MRYKKTVSFITFALFVTVLYAKNLLNQNQPATWCISPSEYGDEPLRSLAFDFMDYQRIYDSIIGRAKLENRKKGEGVYYEPARGWSNFQYEV